MKRLDVTHHRTVRGLTRLALAGLICSGMLSPRTGFASPVVAAPILVTNVADFNRVVSADSNRVVSVRLEATVWWANAKSGRLLLAGDSGAEQLELDLPCQMPKSGDRLRLEGSCLLARTKDAIKLVSLPVVDNDGLHGPEERAGEVYLETGRHAIRVAWLNRTSPSSVLEVGYQGPDLPRQPIPDAALFRVAAGSLSGTTNYVNGLDYRCCQGLWWNVLPDLNHLAAVKSGTTTNFDVGLRTQDAQVGLLFSGYLQIARPGRYTFYTKSSDGSRLFIGEPSILAEVVGQVTLPSPRPMAIGQPVAETADYFRSAIEGTVTFVDRLQDDLELELSAGAERVHMIVADNSMPPFILAPRERIRAVGVCHSLLDLDGHRYGGEFFVQDRKDIEQVDVSSSAAGEGEPSPVLTTVEQIYQLSDKEVAQGHPVKLRGVVTSIWAHESVILQDTTRAIFVAAGKFPPPSTGDYCEVEGVTAAAFAPYVVASRVKTLGPGSMPKPARPTWDQLLNGSMHCQYVELEGVVTMNVSNSITLLTREGRINVKLHPMGPQLPKAYENAVVQLRGCLIADFGRQSPYVQVGNIFVYQQSFDVVEPAPSDVFAIPTKAIGDLLRFDPRAGALQRVKVSGQIVHRDNAECFLMDGTNGLRFIPAGTNAAHVCDRVEVAGFPDWNGASPLLREAVIRRLGPEELPAPHPLEADNLLRDDYDSTLVKVTGILVGLASEPERTVLDMQSGLQRFAAVLDNNTGPPDHLAPGSRLELTGVYVGQGGNRVLGRPIESFHLLLNSRSDIQVLARPAWWTLKRLLTVVGLLICILAAALIWIRLLQQKVGERTLQLEAQIQQRQHAERQREIEQERSRVAQDLHDDLGAGLTRVNILTSLVNSPATAGEDKARHLEDLNEIARDMVTSLDEIVWAVNPRNDTLASLVGYFCAHAQRLFALASIKCGLEVADDLPDFPLDSKFRHEILLAFKEAITNVIRHSGATKVLLRIAIRDGILILEVVDNGRGIEPGKHDTGADGLANIHERLIALAGRCEIQSEPGKGTSVRFEAPLPKNSYD